MKRLGTCLNEEIKIKEGDAIQGNQTSDTATKIKEARLMWKSQCLKIGMRLVMR